MMTADAVGHAVRAHFSARLDGCVHLPDMLVLLQDGRFDDALRQHGCACDECRSLLEDWPRIEPLFTVQAESPAVERAQAMHRRNNALIGLAIAAAILMGVALLLLPNAPPTELIATKGNWSLEVAVRRGNATFRAVPGQRLQTGDELGLFFSAARAGHLHVAYMDSSGYWVELYPGEGHDDSVDAGVNVRLRAGALLTAGTGCEAIIGMFSSVHLDDAEVKEILTSIRRGPDGCPRGETPTLRIFEVRR